MDVPEKDLYRSIEEATKQMSQDLDLVGQGKGTSQLKSVLKKAFVKDKARFEDSWKKSYLLLDPKRKSKKSKKPRPPQGLTHKERKELKVFDIPKEQQKFSIFEPLHALWCGYMEEAFRLSHLQSSGVNNTQEDLTKADYHGAMLKVVESNNPSLVGVEGIVTRETRNTFHLITRADQLKIIPKSVCTFEYAVGNVRVKIYGVNFCSRPADRIKRKLGKRKPIRVI
ncbi:ribonuclease P protein subunit p29-like [Paramacrobiotus metropolitanus]|uniref:ribonuclease P protein subunit p29-like n=1 Tax=Paramacrobiotus metropolitanus TaxID=2943436 RepID=UPI002445CE34|nr:ribonuclease P protein subunit p29-like [Paramacrobiotus metropolitanus]